MSTGTRRIPVWLRTEQDSCTRPTMSLSRRPLPQQHCRAGSPCDQTADPGEPRLPLFRGGGANDPRLRKIREGQVRWLAKGDIAEQVRFVKHIFALSA